jgi:hypothetical protein
MSAGVQRLKSYVALVGLHQESAPKRRIFLPQLLKPPHERHRGKRTADLRRGVFLPKYLNPPGQNHRRRRFSLNQDGPFPHHPKELRPKGRAINIARQSNAVCRHASAL